MRLPDFFIIGAAKSGTTSLHVLLDRHPQVFMPARKEPEFFARDSLYAEGIASYAEAYADAGPNQVCGEASTIYSLSPFFPETARRILEHAPEARLIYIMREPVARAYSYYNQLIKNYQNDTGDHAFHRTFEDFVLPECHAKAAPRDRAFAHFDHHLPDDPELCLAGSDYLYQIKCYLEHFSRDRFLFLKYEDFARHEAATLRQITDFLSLEPLSGTVLDGDLAHQNISSMHFERIGAQDKLASLARAAGPLWKARQWLPQRVRAVLRRRYIRITKAENMSATVPPPMLHETRAILARRFLKDLDELSQLTGLDLSDWNQPKQSIG